MNGDLTSYNSELIGSKSKQDSNNSSKPNPTGTTDKTLFFVNVVMCGVSTCGSLGGFIKNRKEIV